MKGGRKDVTWLGKTGEAFDQDLFGLSEHDFQDFKDGQDFV
jgi:hypothetical protein